MFDPRLPPPSRHRGYRCSAPLGRIDEGDSPPDLSEPGLPLVPLGEWADGRPAAGAHFGPPAATSAFDRGAVAREIHAEVDRLGALYPGVDAGLLRERLLAELDYRLRDMIEGLDRPGVSERVEFDLFHAQEEIDSLLRALRPQDARRSLVPAEQKVFSHLLLRLASPALDRFALPRHSFGPSAREGLRQAATVLVAAGIRTPAEVDALLQAGLRHDHRLQVAMGGFAQLGYGAGFYLFHQLVAPLLAPRLLGQGFWPAFGFGALAGVLVGACDAVVTAGAAGFAESLAYASPGRQRNAAALAMQDDEARRLVAAGAIQAGSITLKNILLRVLLPTLAIQSLWPQGLDRAARAQVDTALDVGGGLLAGALAAHLRYRLLDNAQSHAFKLLVGEDFETLLGRMQRPLAAGDIGTALRMFGESAARAVVSPSTCLVTLGVMAPMIGLLFAAQEAVPAGLGVAAAGALQALAPALREAPRPPPMRALEHGLRTGISTATLGVAVFVATLAGGAAAPRLDPGVLRGCLAAARCLVGEMRRRPAAPDGGTLRRRRSAGGVPV